MKNPKKKGKQRRTIRKAWPRVSELKNGGSSRFLVDGRPFRERKFFDREDSALVLAEVWANEKENHGVEGFQISSDLRRQVANAVKILEPWDRSLDEAAKWYAAHLQAEQKRKDSLTVATCLNHWLDKKEEEMDLGRLSRGTFLELRSKANVIRAGLGEMSVAEVDEATVETFLHELPQSPRGRFNIRTKLSQFMSFCRRQKWIASNPAADVKVRVPDQEVSILTVEECEEMLDVASAEAPQLLAYIAVSMFSGLRPKEAEQLRWERIDWETSSLHVLGSTSKVRQTRYVAIEDNLVSWLSLVKQTTGEIVSKGFQRDWKKLRQTLGYSMSGTKKRTWPYDCLRHCYGSYWLAHHQNRAQLAELMGNSPEVIAKHYRRPVPRLEAERFWSLRPKVRMLQE